MPYIREVEFRTVVLHNLFVSRLIQLEKQIRKLNISENSDLVLRDSLLKERDYLYEEARALNVDLGVLRISVSNGVNYRYD